MEVDEKNDRKLEDRKDTTRRELLWPEEEVKLCGVDLFLHEEDLEGHLGGEDQLVTLKEAPGKEKGNTRTVKEL